MGEAKRKLTAILAADVAGYSRLMGVDEEGTVAALDACRAIFKQAIESHDGQLIDTAGDSVLATFDSVVQAVRCSVAVQNTLAKRDAQLANDKRMRFRIGVNLGDVITKSDGTIYGDGVNVAARLESLAEPGGIMISEMVRMHLRSQSDIVVTNAGEHEVKNIAEPVHAYRIELDGAAPQPRNRRKFSPVKILIVWVVLLVAVLVWSKFFRDDEPEGSTSALPDGPSIAVLPFDNLSADPEQEYFSDGISETIITDLSKLRGLKVIARNSSFAYKGQSIDLRKVSRELGVRHILEGSVQKAESRVRITAQLIDGATGDHIWASRWDRPLHDIFALQDEITRKIVTELDVTLVEGDQARVWRRSTSSPVAYDLLLRAGEFKPPTKAVYDRSKAFLEEAVQIDPEFAVAWVRLGWTQVVAGYSGWADSPDAAWDSAIDHAYHALTIDPELGDAYTLLTEVMMFKRDQAQAMRYAKRAVELNPNGADTQAIVAIHTCWTGDSTGLFQAERAMSLNPHPPGWYYNALGSCYRINKRYQEAIAAEEKCAELAPDYLFCYVHLALASLETGDEDAASRYSKEIIRINPNFRSAIVLQGYVDPAVKEYHRELFHKLGIQ